MRGPVDVGMESARIVELNLDAFLVRESRFEGTVVGLWSF